MKIDKTHKPLIVHEQVRFQYYVRLSQLASSYFVLSLSLSLSPLAVVGSCLVDFGFLVDSSGSICNNKGGKNCINWASVRTFLQDVVRNMRIEETGSRVGMILFGSYATVLWQLNT